MSTQTRPFDPAPPPSQVAHCYSFSYLETDDERYAEAAALVSSALQREPERLSVREVRSVAPSKAMLLYTFQI